MLHAVAQGEGWPVVFVLEIRAAMEKKAAEFRSHGGEIYLPKPAAE